MPVTCTGTIRLALDHAEVNQLEDAIVQAGLHIMAQRMTQALTSLEERRARRYPHCARHTLVGDDLVPYHLRTRFGTVPVRRRHDRCTACRRAVRPLDPLLSTAGPGRATQGLVELAP